MEKIIVKRTGKAPLRFEGELLADCDSEIMAGNERTRWFSVRVYRLSDGRLVVAITYHSRWRGESEFAWAERWPLAALDEAFQAFEGEFYGAFHCWNSVSPRSDRDWERLNQDLKQLCSDVCETCGAVENLEAPEDTETENGG